MRAKLLMLAATALMAVVALLASSGGIPASAAVPYSYVTGWGASGAGNGQFNAPNAVSLDASGNILVADTGNNRIQRFSSLDATVPHLYMAQVSTFAATPSTLNEPRGVSVDSNGDIWISDTGNNRIIKLNRNFGVLVNINPGTGKKGGDLNSPSQIVNANGYMWQLDAGLDRIQRFRLTGAYDNKKWSATGVLRFPYDISFDASGTYCYVSSGAAYHNVARFTHTAGVLGSARSFVGRATPGSADGWFDGPRGVAVHDGRLFVADHGNDRVQVFDVATGAFITKFGGTGTAAGQLVGPTGVTVDSKGRVYVVDSGNNRVQVFYADYTPPVTTDNAPVTWRTTAPVNVSLVATDAGLGVAATYYRVNAGSVVTYTAPIAISTEGTNTLEYWSVDHSGNIEATKTATVRLDTVRPVTADDAPVTWWPATVDVSLTASDAASGVTATYFRRNAGATTTYTGPIAVTAETTTTISYWSVDRAGNVEATKTATVRIDLGAPVSTATVPAWWTASKPVTVTMSATDATSGVRAIHYTRDGGAPTTYTGPISVSVEGTTTFQHWAVDNAGNSETPRTALVRIDTAVPTGTMTVNNGDTYTATTTVSVNSEMTDISPMEMRIDPGTGYGAWIPYAPTTWVVVSPAGDGTKTVTAQYRDAAGNAATRTDTIRLDTTAPEGTMTVNGGSAYTTTTAASVESTVVRAVDMRVDRGTGVYGGWFPYTSSVSTALPAGDGAKTVRVEYRNGTGMTVTLVAVVTLDTAAPSGAMAVARGAAYTSTRTVSVDSTVTDTTPMQMRVDPGTGSYGGWFPYAATVTTQLPAGDGTKTVNVQYRDSVAYVLTLSDTIMLDTAAPTLSDDAPAAWRPTPTFVTLSATDSGSGPAWIRYRLNGGAATTYTVPVLVSAEGTSTILYWAADNAGNVSASRVATVQLDFTRPATTDNAPAGWRNTSPVSVTLTAADALSGVLSTRYRLNGGSVATYTAAISVSSQGTNTVEYWSTDRAGNVEATRTAFVRIDTVAPSTAASIPAGWSRTGELVLIPTDASSGVFETFYDVDNQGVALYTEPVFLADEGDLTIAYWSVDLAGNTESPPKSATMRVDLSPPVTVDNAPSGWVSATPVAVSLAASDAVSGVGSTHYTRDGGALTTYTAAISVSTQGTTTLVYRTTDVAGNIEASRTAYVRIDSVAPTGTMAINNGDSYVGTRTVSIDSSVTDMTAVQMRYDAGAGYSAWVPYTSSVTTVVPAGDGTKTVTAQYRDAAGNLRTIADTITLDTNAPSGTVLLNGGASHTSTVTATVDSTMTNAVTMRVDPGSGSYGGWFAYASRVTTLLPAGDGLKTVRIEYRNGVGTTVTFIRTITLDTAAPAGTMVVQGDATWTTTRTVSVDSAVTDLSAIEMRVDAGSGYGAWAPYASSVMTVLASGDGTKTVTAQYRDVLGQTLTLADTIGLDTAAPVLGDDAPAAWRTSTVLVTLFPADTVSGLAWTRYSLNGAAETTYAVPVAVSLQGTNTLSYHAADRAGNVSAPKVVTVRIDGSAPLTVDNAPSGWSTVAPVAVSLSASDAVSGVSATYYRLNGAATATYTSAVSVSLAGTNTLQYWSVDRAGNTESTRTATVRIDTLAPSGTMAISGGAAQTSTRTVSVDSAVSDLTSVEMRFDAGSGYSAWFPYASSVTTVVPTGDGTKTVTAQYRDLAGNVLTLADTIVLDTAAPSGTMTVNGGASHTSTRSVSVTSSVSNAASMAVDPGSGVFGSWIAYSASVTTQLPSGDGTKTVRVQYRALSGATLTLTDTIILDTAAPSGTMAIAKGGAWTATRTVSVDSTVTDLTAIEMRFDAGSGYGPWAAYASSVTTVLPSGDGTKTVTAQYRDVLGQTLTLADTIVLDTAAPAGTMAIAKGVAWTATRTVSVDSTVTDLTAIQMRFDAGSGYGPWAAYASSVTTVLPSGDGTKTVTAQYRDVLGQTLTLADTIVLDTAAPLTVDNAPAGWSATSPVAVSLGASDAVSGVLATYYRLNGGATTTYAAAVNVSNEGTNTLQYWSVDRAGNTEPTRTATVRIDTAAPSGTMAIAKGAAWTATRTVSVDSTVTDLTAIQMRFDAGSGYGPWAAYASSVTTVLPAGDGTKTVTAQYRDVLGQTLTLADTIILDTAAPAGTMAIAKGAAWTATRTVSVDSTVTDLTAIEMRFDAGSGYGPWAAYASSVTTVLPSGDGTKTVTAQYRDVLGQTLTLADTIILDTAAPAGTMAIAKGAAWTATRTVSVDSTVTDLTAIQMRFDAGGGYGPWAAYASSVTTVLPSGDGTKTVTAQYRDVLGQTLTLADTIVLDTAAPLLADDAPSAWSRDPVFVTLTASDAVSGVAWTRYRLNAGAETTYVVPVLVSAQGTNTIAYSAADRAGNLASPNMATVRIDWEPPVTSDDAPVGWRASTPVTVTLNAADAVSGVLAIRYRLNGGTVATCTAPLEISSAGATVIEYWSVDVAGNVEATKTATVRIDTAAPVTSDDAPAGWSTSPVSVTLSAADAHSGVAVTRYRLNGGALTTYTAPVPVSGEGTNTLQYRSTDAAGNVEATRSATVRVDMTTPSTFDGAPSGWVSATPVAVPLTAADAHSGVASTVWWQATTRTVPVRYEQVDPFVYLTGTWSSTSGSLHSGGSYIWRAEPVGATAHFTGTAVSYVTVKGPMFGLARVTLDGTSELVDLYSPILAYQSSVWSRGGLVDGPHTVTIEWSGLKSPMASGTYVGLDALDVVGSLVASGAPFYTAYAGPVPVSSEGVTAIGYRSVDLAGNVESSRTAFVRIDASAPAGTFALCGGDDYIGTEEITIDSAVTDMTDLEMRIDAGNGWSAWVPYASSVPTVVPAGDGTKTVTVEYRDLAANVLSLSDTIVLVSGPPSGTMTVNSGASHTGTSAVLVESTVVGAVDMRIDPGSGVYGGWTEYASAAAAVLPPPDGSKLVRVQYRSGTGLTKTLACAIVLDTSAPTGMMAVSNGLPYTTTRTVTIDSIVNDLSALEMRYDAGRGLSAWIPYASTVTTTLLAGDGTKAVTAQYRDVAGHTSTLGDTIVLDTIGPVSAASGIPAGWGSVDVTFSLAATDAGSGVSAVRYRLGSGPVQTYAAPVVVTAEGATVISYWASDLAGNVEATKTATIRIDRGDPSTSILGVPAGWSRSNVLVSFSATDTGSGVAVTRYRLNGGAIATYTAPFTVTQEGTTTVTYWSVDVAGRVEAERSAVLRIDRTAPVTTAGVLTSSLAATVTLSPSDAHSGVAKTWWSLNGGPAALGRLVTVDIKGSHTVSYWSVDAAGNVEATKTASFAVGGSVEVTYVAVWGSTRYETAIQISKRAFPAGSPTLIISTGANYPDALGGGALAGAYECPILLVPGAGKVIPTAVRTEILRLGPNRVVILGGTAAVSRDIETAIRKLAGVTSVQRIGGATRYETADMVALEAFKVLGAKGKPLPSSAFIVTGRDFADALIVSPIVYSTNRPLLLVDGTALRAKTRDALDTMGITAAMIVDSGNRVPASVEAVLVAKYGAGNVSKLTATGPSAMSVKVATFAEGLGMTADGVGVATSGNFPDALAAGPMQGKLRSFLLLTPTAPPLDPNVRDALVARKGTITRLHYFGGTVAITQPVRDAIADALR